MSYDYETSCDFKKIIGFTNTKRLALTILGLNIKQNNEKPKGSYIIMRLISYSRKPTHSVTTLTHNACICISVLSIMW